MSGDLFSRPGVPLVDAQPPAAPDVSTAAQESSEAGATPDVLSAAVDDAGLAAMLSAPDAGASRGGARSIVPEERDLLREAEPTLPPGALDPEVMDAIGSALRRPASRRPSVPAPPSPPAPAPGPARPAFLDPVEASFFRPDPPAANASPEIGADLEAAFLGEPAPSVPPPPPAPDPSVERETLARTLRDGVPRRAVAGSGESDRVTYRPVQPGARRPSASRILSMLAAFALLVGIGAAGAWLVRRPSTPAVVATAPDAPADPAVVTPTTSTPAQGPERAAPEVVATQPESADHDGAEQPSAAETPSPEPVARASQSAAAPDAPVTLANTLPPRSERAPASAPSVAPAALFARAASLPPDQGLLMIVSDRPGAVYVDGRALGDLAVLGPLTLTAGVHRIRVVTTGTDREADARVDAGQVRAIQFRFGASGGAR